MRLLKIILLVSVLSLLACTEIDEPISVPRDSSVTDNSKYRTEAELKNIALQAYSAIMGYDIEEVASRAGGSMTITPILPRLSRASSDTLIQVVNYGNGQGFALVGAQKGSEDLLALVEEGDYNPIEISQVEGFEDFISRAELLLSSKPNIGDTAICQLNTKVEYVNSVAEFYGPHVSVQWGQRDYFGAYCPNNICGCVPLSTAMVMSYFEQPASMIYTFPERDVQYSYLNWQSMKSHFKRHTDTWPEEWNGVQLPDASNCQATAIDHSNLGRVVRQIGFVSDPAYKPNVTIASTVRAIDYLKSKVPDLKVQLYTSPEKELINGLDEGIAIVDGWTGEDYDSSDGHCWVNDGYAILGVLKKTYRNYHPDRFPEEWTLISSEVMEFKDLLHFNWGWNGKCNGYFLTNCYKPNEATQNDEGASKGSIDDNFKFHNRFFLIQHK